MIQCTIAIFLKKTLTKKNHIGYLFENNGKMRTFEDLRAKLGLDDNKNFIGDKLSMQSFVLGKKCF